MYWPLRDVIATRHRWYLAILVRMLWPSSPGKFSVILKFTYPAYILSIWLWRIQCWRPCCSQDTHATVPLIQRFCYFIIERYYISEECFVLNKFFLAVPCHLFIFHLLGHGFKEGLLNKLLRDLGEAERLIVSWILLPIPEGECDISFQSFDISCYLDLWKMREDSVTVNMQMWYASAARAKNPMCLIALYSVKHFLELQC